MHDVDIKPWQHELLTALQGADREGELFTHLEKCARQIGFDYCAYGLQMPYPLSNPKTIMLSNYPEEWQRRYISENYLQIDPTVRHGKATLIPIVWSEDIFKSARGFWEEAQSYGLRVGWAQASIDSRGIRGMLTMARSAEPLSETELAEKGYQLVWLTQVMHQRISQLVATRIAPERAFSLTQREIGALRWTAEGKTSAEISDILSISERTVNFHIANAMEKLCCINKTSASVRAALLGLLN